MASINGLTIKSMKEFTGHEGEPLYQGNLYLGNKKLGFWSQDYRGGVCDRFDLDPGYSYDKLSALIAEAHPEKVTHGVSYSGKPYLTAYEPEFLMEDMVNLTLMEKEYKKFVKKGFPVMFVATDGFHEKYYAFVDKFRNYSDEKIAEDIRNSFGDLDDGMYVNKEVQHLVYRSLDDFNIGETFQLEQICA